MQNVLWGRSVEVLPTARCSRLPLTSELDALCAEYTNSILLRRVKFSSPTPIEKKKKRVASTLFFFFWSKCGDSNSRPPVPETGALPTALHLEISKLKVENGKLKVVFVVVGYYKYPKPALLPSAFVSHSFVRQASLALLAMREIASSKTILNRFPLALQLSYTRKCA